MLILVFLGEKMFVSSEFVFSDGYVDFDGDFILVCVIFGVFNMVDVSGLFVVFFGF